MRSMAKRIRYLEVMYDDEIADTSQWLDFIRVAYALQGQEGVEQVKTGMRAVPPPVPPEDSLPS